MKAPWFAFYMADYLAKTGHLTQGQHGAYMLLMIHYYATGRPIPANAMQVHAICRCTTDAEKDAAMQVLAMFFDLDGAVYRHRRIDEELVKRSEISGKRQKAANKKWGKGDANTPAKPMQVHMHVDTQSQSHTHKEGITPPTPSKNPESQNVPPGTTPELTEQGTPLGLSKLEYAKVFLEQARLPVSANLRLAADSIESIGNELKQDLAYALDYLVERAADARSKKIPVDHLWLLNGRYWPANEQVTDRDRLVATERRFTQA